MSLFVDLRQIRSSVGNLSTMIEEMSDRMGNIKMGINLQKKYHGEESTSKAKEQPCATGAPILKPRGKFDVHFTQSQEDLAKNIPITPSLKAHYSMPNLEKFESWPSDHATYLRKESESKSTEDLKNNKIIVPLENVSEWVILAAQKRPYFDDISDENPIDFLEDLQQYIQDVKLRTEKQLQFAISCLGGNPLMWARCFRSNFKNVQEFYKAFRDEFWGYDQQKGVMFDLKLGKYDDKNAKMTMSEYFLRKVTNFRHLDPAPSDLEIIYSMAAHFPQAIELELRLLTKPSLRDAYRMLKRRDEVTGDFLPNYLFEMCENYQKRFKSGTRKGVHMEEAAGSERAGYMTA